MKNTSTLLLLCLFAVLALIALCGPAVSAAPPKQGSKEASKSHVEMLAKAKGASKVDHGKKSMGEMKLHGPEGKKEHVEMLGKAKGASKVDHGKKPMGEMKPDGPEAKKAYEERLAKCKDSSKEERCEMLARFFVYHDCMDAEESCAFDHGKNGCMEKTFDCIENVLGTD